MTSKASVLKAASVAYADVRASVNSAVDGDTVIIPAGTATWTTNLHVSKAITIQGATTVSGDHKTSMSANDQTIIIDGVPKTTNGNAQAVLFVTLAANTSFRLTGVTFKGASGGAQGYNGTVQIYGSMPTIATATQVRVDHCHFDNLHDLNLLINTAVGVADHNVFDLGYTISNGQLSGNAGNGFHVAHGAWNGGASGDGSWADSPLLGSADALFAEDNTFNNGYANDCNSGGHMVFRYNTCTNGVVQNHRAAGRERAGRVLEVYNNTFYWTDSVNKYPFAIYLTAGTGVIWGNTSTNYVNLVTAVNQRSDRDEAPFGKATGSNPWDKNSDSSGYACIGQVGRGKGDLITGATPVNSTTGTAAWPHEAAEPFYEWSDTYHKPSDYQYATLWSVTEGAATLRQGRDFYLNTQMPGYQPYVYPHPLAGQSLPAPRNLRVISAH